MLLTTRFNLYLFNFAVIIVSFLVLTILWALNVELFRAVIVSTSAKIVKVTLQVFSLRFVYVVVR